MSSGAMWLAVCLAGGAQGQELPRATMEYGAFAFPDPSGMRLLTVSEPTQPELLHTVFCSDGRRASVRFDHRQTERDGHNGREGIVLLRAARSCPVKSTLPIVFSRRTSPHPIQRTRGCGAGGGEPTAGGVD